MLFASCQPCLTVSHGPPGQYGFPGGHLEFGESYFECAGRETLEETGLRIKATRVLAIANSVFDSLHHYITIFVQCEQEDSDEQPQVSRHSLEMTVVPGYPCERRHIQTPN
jgi:ADP-ribose pyrophosphatase YjhB (NUDIX family)